MSAMSQTTPTNPDLLLSSIFSACSLEFRSKVPDNLIDSFAEIRKLEDLERAIRDIEARQADRKSLRYLNKIKPCLNALDEYSKAIEVFVNAKPEIMTLVWGPIKVCLLIASKYEKAFDSLLLTYVKIKAALPHFSAVEQLFEANPYIQNVLGNVYKDILAFHLRALTFFMRPGWSIALRITCRALEDMFDDIFSNLERSKDLFYSSASIAHYQAAQEARLQLAIMFKTQQETARVQKRAVVHTWLNPTEHHGWQEQLCDLRGEYPQTAKWIFDEPGWNNWLNNEEKNGRMFWVSGIPGAGKTMIFSAMVEELMSRSKENKSFAVAYVYCKYNDCQRNSFTELARSLIHQLVGHNDICGEYLFDVAANSVERTVSKKQTLVTIIQDILQCYDEVCIGIDGLDECEQKERGTLIQLLKELLKLPLPTPSLHIFVTSQAELDIERFMASALYHVEIGPKNLSEDILCYVEKRSAELARFGLTSQQIGDLNEEVSARSAGMFLLARLIFDLFERCATRADFDEEYAEKGLPAGIEEAYGRILSRVRKREKESGRARAKLLLEILSCAKRKLYIHELQGMLSMDMTNHRIEFSKRRYTQHFKEICGPLVELNLDGTVDLVHQTVKEYLDQYHSEYISLATAAFNSAKICTSYLSLDGFKSTHQNEKMTEAARSGDFAFHKYAILQWLPHIHSLQEHHITETQISVRLGKDVRTIYETLSSFSESAFHDEEDMQPAERNNLGRLLENLESTYKELWQNHDEESPVIRQISRIQTFIEAAVSSEIGCEKESFLKEAYGPRPYQCTSLSCSRFYDGFSTSQDRDAHLRGHERQFLCLFQDCEFYSVGFPTKRALDAHIDAFHVASLLPQFSDLKPRSVWITLQEAIGTDDEALLEGLCVEAAKYPGKPSGLVARAIAKSHFNSARILLRHFHSLGDLKDTKFQPRKLLSTLAEADQVSLTREILSLCPTLGWNYWDFANTLLGVIGKGHEDVVTFFLEQVRLRDSQQGYWAERKYAQRKYAALIAKAARVGSRNELLVMFDKIGKDCHPPTLSRCCLEMAAEGNTTALKQVLPYFLENFAKEAKSMKRFSNLQHLSIDDAVMRLTRGTVRPSKDGKGSGFRSKFQLAAFHGDTDELSRILELGIDINDMSGQYGTALQAASRRGHVHVVQWLLERGAQVGSVGGDHGNAIAAAAATGHVEALEILLEAGQNASQEARANAKKGYRKTTLCLVYDPTTATPLHFAVAELQEEAVQVLIEAGADVLAIDSNGNTALHMCVLGPYSQSYGRHHTTSWTKKSVAARIRRSSDMIAGLLLERGAIATAQNNYGNSPLHLLFIEEIPDKGSSVRTQAGVHPCAVQMAKLLFEGGASFDLLNKGSISAREAAIRIGGQVLEDLKRETPTAWQGIYEFVGGVKTLPSPLVEPPNDSSKNSSAGPSLDEEIHHFQEEETNKLDAFDGDNMTSHMPDFWNGGDTSKTISALYTPSDMMQWKATSSNETDIYSHSMIHDGHLTSNDTNPSGNERNQPSNHFYHPNFDLFMNPWEDT